MKKLLGFNNYISKKDGKAGCVFFVSEAFKSDEISRGAVGETVDRLWMPREQVNYLKPEHIGKFLQIEYDVQGKTAYIASVTIK